MAVLTKAEAGAEAGAEAEAEAEEAEAWKAEAWEAEAEARAQVRFRAGSGRQTEVGHVQQAVIPRESNVCSIKN